LDHPGLTEESTNLPFSLHFIICILLPLSVFPSLSFFFLFMYLAFCARLLHKLCLKILSLWSQSSSKKYLRIQPAPEREHNSPLQRSIY
jgi:hypothetical protein